MERIIFHIDVNSAYLSWTAVEQLKNGAKVDLREIPAIVGGDQKSRHGIVLAKSTIAQKFGIRTGEPVANALKKCPNLVMVPPDMNLYMKNSKKLMDFLRSFTDQIEQLSVDECYLDMTNQMGKFHSPIDAALEMKEGVSSRFGFTVNIGISSNKLLAKMASDFEKPDRIHTLFPEEIPTKMWPLPVGELYMVGKATVETLRKLEIMTIKDLATVDLKLLNLHLKSYGTMLWDFANGRDDSPVRTLPSEAKGIGNSTTMPEDVETTEEAHQVLKRLAASVGRRLRKAGQKAYMVSIEIKYHNFQKISHQKQLPQASNNDEVIFAAACQLLEAAWQGDPIRLLGIRTAKLVDESEPEQMTVFDFLPGS